MKTKTGLAMGIMGLLANLLFGQTKGDADIAARVKAGALVVDVRTAGEFAGGHIANAVNIPYDTIGRKIAKHASDKNRPIIVYCQSGARSAVARQTLEKAGYTQVVNGGGYARMRKLLE